MSELKNGSLIIEVDSKEQATKIMQMTCLNNVKVKEHSSLNYTKGTIRYKRFIDVAEDILVEELKHAKVTEVYKIKKKQQNEFVNTGTMILVACSLLSTSMSNEPFFNSDTFLGDPFKYLSNSLLAFMVPTVFHKLTSLLAFIT